jgi:hypothetical protein
MRFPTVARWYRISIDCPEDLIMNRFLLLLLTATLLSSASLLADQSPLVQVNLESFLLSADHQSATALAVLHNNSGVDVTNVDIDIALTSLRPTTISAANPPTWRLDWSCQSTGAQSIRCRLPLLSGTPGAFWPLLITIDPASSEERYSLTAQATWSVAGTTFTSPPWTVRALFQREVVITNTNDDGEGSFRAALTYANDACARDLVPCALHFRFTEPKPEQGWYTIRPLTPFPAITAPDITIEQFSNLPGEPSVELDGSLLHSGNGLELRGEGLATINYPLSIGGFPWDGIVITRRGGTSISCTVGRRPNGQPNGNGSRGVSIDTPAADVGLSVRSGANGRSGLFIMGGERITVDSSGIGRLFGDSALLGNGASGVFVGPNARDVAINRSFIGGNAQMGVAIAPEARGVRIEDTWINPNGGLPIDHGLNGFSGEIDDPSRFALPAPRIDVATYDPTTKLTTIQGTFDAPDPDASWELTVYGSSIGDWPESDLPRYVFRGRTFSVAVPFLSGPVRATVGSANFSDWSTSEYSQPVEVRSAGRSPF